MKVPRNYQQQAMADVFAYAVAHPTGRLLLVIPPGGGKTLIAALLLHSAVMDGGLHALVVAHRREIVVQHYKHLIDDTGLPPELVGVIMGDDQRTNPNAPIQVCSIDTLRHRDKPRADVVIADEAHRDASDYRRKLRALYSDAFHLGITATPCRLDGRGLVQDFDELLVAATYAELFAGGWIIRPRIFTVPDIFRPDLRGMRRVRGEYEGVALGRAVMRKVIIGHVVDHWLARADGRSTVLFAASIKHSKALVAAFQARGIDARHLDLHCSDAKRDELLSAFRAGAIPILSCVNILAEGWESRQQETERNRLGVSIGELD